MSLGEEHVVAEHGIVGEEDAVNEHRGTINQYCEGRDRVLRNIGSHKWSRYSVSSKPGWCGYQRRRCMWQRYDVARRSEVRDQVLGAAVNITMSGDAHGHAGAISTIAREGVNVRIDPVDVYFLTVAHAVGDVDMRDEGHEGVWQAAVRFRRAEKIGYNLVTRRGWSPNRFCDLNV